MPTNLLPCCAHEFPLRVNTQVPPIKSLSACAPMIAVLPLALKDTEEPKAALPTRPVPINLLPCCVQLFPFRVNTHDAPLPLLSFAPPTIAVLPSALIATE